MPQAPIAGGFSPRITHARNNTADTVTLLSTSGTPPPNSLPLIREAGLSPR